MKLYKSQSSSQCIKYFQKLQHKVGITEPLMIPHYCKTRWGSAYAMMERICDLRKVSLQHCLIIYIDPEHQLTGN